MLLAMLRLDPETYTVPLVQEIEARTGRRVAPSAVYITLRRLERKGLVSSRFEATKGRGRPRRLFALEPSALELLKASKEALVNLWDGVAALEG